MKDHIRIAILGNCTTDYVGKELQAASARHGIPAEIYNAPYNQYVQEILNPDSGLYAYGPELIILWLEGKVFFPEWYDMALLLGKKEQKLQQANNASATVTSLVETIRSKCGAKIIVNNFKVLYYSPLGILDNKFHPGLKAMISLVNSNLEEWAQDKEGIYIFDYSSACAQYGLDAATDKKIYYAAKSPVSYPFTRVIAAEYMRYILPIKSKNKKCLVLDLDNTLWGGIAGEEGLQGVTLDISGPGRAFYDFQQTVLNLHSKGVLLAVCSKNNVEDAMEIIEQHPYMLLRKKYFSALKINWENKASNLREIAEELGIGIESIVFADDSPLERELVRTLLPEVTVADMPADTAKYAEALEKLPYFELLSITEDDLKRNEMYQVKSKREELLQNITSIDQFLSEIGLVITLEEATTFTIPRISQLTLKTNQFNMTTKRYQTSDIQKMLKSGDYAVVSCSVRDRLGDSGISGVCIAKLQEHEAVIDTFLLSCRVLGLGIEYAFLSTVVESLREKGIGTIYGIYMKTSKNTANESFFREAGFSAVSSEGNETRFILKEGEALKHQEYIKIEKKQGAGQLWMNNL